MKKLLLLPLVLLGFQFTPKLIVKIGIATAFTYSREVKAQTPLTKEDADTYYKPIGYTPTLSAVQIDGTPYLRVDDMVNYENSVYIWNMIQSKPEFMGVCFNALFSQLYEDVPIVHFELQELAISGNSLSIKTGTVVINTITLPDAIVTSGSITDALGFSPLSSETQSLSITGQNLSIKSGGSTINTITIPTQTTGLATSSSLTSGLAGKFDNPTGSTSQYLKGDGSLGTLPSQITQTLVGSSGITISSGANTYTVSKTKRQETYSGTTDSSGNYTVTFGTAYSVAPNIQANPIGGSTENFLKIVSISTTGFTTNVFQRANVLSLALSTATTAVSGASVDVLITEK